MSARHPTTPGERITALALIFAVCLGGTIAAAYLLPDNPFIFWPCWIAIYLGSFNAGGYVAERWMLGPDQDGANR